MKGWMVGKVEHAHWGIRPSTCYLRESSAGAFSVSHQVLYHFVKQFVQLSRQSSPCWQKKHDPTKFHSWTWLLVASLSPLSNRALTGKFVQLLGQTCSQKSQLFDGLSPFTNCAIVSSYLWEGQWWLLQGQRQWASHTPIMHVSLLMVKKLKPPPIGLYDLNCWQPSPVRLPVS